MVLRLMIESKQFRKRIFNLCEDLMNICAIANDTSRYRIFSCYVESRYRTSKQELITNIRSGHYVEFSNIHTMDLFVGELSGFLNNFKKNQYIEMKGKASFAVPSKFDVGHVTDPKMNVWLLRKGNVF